MDLVPINKQFLLERNPDKYGTGMPYITFGADGCCFISPEACAVLDVKHGDRLMFYANKDEKNEWFVSRSYTSEQYKEGYKLSRNKSNKGLAFRSTRIAQMVCDVIGVNQETVKLPITEVTKQPKGMIYEIFRLEFKRQLKVLKRGPESKGRKAMRKHDIHAK